MTADNFDLIAHISEAIAAAILLGGLVLSVLLAIAGSKQPWL